MVFGNVLVLQRGNDQRQCVGRNRHTCWQSSQQFSVGLYIHALGGISLGGQVAGDFRATDEIDSSDFAPPSKERARHILQIGVAAARMAHDRAKVGTIEMSSRDKLAQNIAEEADADGEEFGQERGLLVAAAI